MMVACVEDPILVRGRNATPHKSTVANPFSISVPSFAATRQLCRAPEGIRVRGRRVYEPVSRYLPDESGSTALLKYRKSSLAADRHSHRSSLFQALGKEPLGFCAMDSVARSARS